MTATKQERDRAVLESLEPGVWNLMGRRGSRYTRPIDELVPVAPEASLKRLVEAGLVMVRTATYAYWGGYELRQRFLNGLGATNMSDLAPAQLAEYRDRFHDRVRIEAMLTREGEEEVGLR